MPSRCPHMDSAYVRQSRLVRIGGRVRHSEDGTEGMVCGFRDVGDKDSRWILVQVQLKGTGNAVVEWDWDLTVSMEPRPAVRRRPARLPRWVLDPNGNRRLVDEGILRPITAATPVTVEVSYTNYDVDFGE